DAQLRAEIEKCEFCREKPCREACPADVSPADFIMAVKVGAPSDFRRAAALIMEANPLGGVCGVVCPDTHCMAACARQGFDRPINIPAVQATIVKKARDLGVMPEFRAVAASGRRVAVVGGGPAGCGAAGLLAQLGHAVTVFEAGDAPGGMAGLIPDSRLDKRVLAADLGFVKALGAIEVVAGARVEEPAALLVQGFDAVVVAAGLGAPLALGIEGEGLAAPALGFLARPESFEVSGKRVAVIGGGAVASDCAAVASERGAATVELLALEKLGEMPLTAGEMAGLLEAGIEVSGRTRVGAIARTDDGTLVLRTGKVSLPAGQRFHPRAVVDLAGSEQLRGGFDLIVVAIGARPALSRQEDPALSYCGDFENGPTTVVEAVAAGKNAALEVDAFLAGSARPVLARRTKSVAVLPGSRRLPVPLETDFFGRPIASPFLLSAAPPTDGYEQMRQAYEVGWPGGVMKTAFDNVPIHIPSQYMFSFSRSTFGNCDNVSDHPLDRVCSEVERLRREFPDRLTLASTGGPVTGDDALDARVWQANTRKLEAAGAFGIEYSLSCPQGGDGTKGDIVSQDAELTARIIGWVLAGGDPAVPKLFKLTAAVTAIHPIMIEIKEMLARFPHHAAGVTLANTFPTLAFRPGRQGVWEEGVVVGMSGAGVAPISNFTLARAAGLGVVVSGNAGPMDYKAAAHFLALGARTVQLCSVVMKHGYAIIGELHSGLSYLLEERGIGSVAELIGCALPRPITPFGELSATKLVSAVESELCERCGNCTRCPYLAITLDAQQHPITEAARCVGCSFCVQQCFTGALFMRERTPAEVAKARE
ncbi:MAG: FAD-dependent oxidoreductase, partial [Acidobacteriota bacterium]